MDRLSKTRAARFRLARIVAMGQAELLRRSADAIEAAFAEQDEKLMAGCEIEEAFYDAAVLAETMNQYTLNTAQVNAPIYAAATAAAQAVMEQCWAGGPSG